MTVTKHASVILFREGVAELWLTNVTRNDDGSLKSGYVENGCWNFEVKGGEVLAKDGRYIVNRWQLPEYEEIHKDPAWRGDYNAVMNAAQDFYDRH